MSSSRNYIVYTFPWNENNGGVIFMHHLVHELNRLGERAFLWKAKPVYKLSRRDRLRSWLKPETMITSPFLDTPVACHRDLTAETIVVYPEIVMGNPLGAQNVTRWLLYTPGGLHPYHFETDELFFRAGPMSDLPEVTGGAPDLYLWKMNPAYFNEERSDRKGICYMVRKGNSKPRIAATESKDAVQVDGMSHTQLNEIFNRYETFYSYDEATMYSQFAAVSGCTSIVVPGMFNSREEWVAQHPNGKFGIAYGDSKVEIEHARSTQHLLLEDMQKKEDESLKTVLNFVNLTRKRFWL